MTGGILTYEVLILLFIALSAFFSAAEIALVSSGRLAVEARARKGSANARRALYLLNNQEYVMNMLLVSNNVAGFAAGSFITYVATRAFMVDEEGLLLVTALQTLLLLVFCEITPKVVSKAKPEALLMLFSLPIKIMLFLTAPLNRVSLLYSRMIRKIFRLKRDNLSAVRSRDELDMFFKMGEHEGIIDEEHHMYVSEILSFRYMTAMEIMTPTIDIVSVELDSPVKHLLEIIEKTRFSRIPVFEKRVDNIVGYVFYRDVLRKKDLKEIQEIMYPARYVPSTKNIFRLFVEMQDDKVPLVFVVNEYGAVTGMVTHEDIAEEVVGEIQTRDHGEEDLIRKVSDREFALSGDLDIEHFQKVFSISIEKRGFETIAGFMMHEMGPYPLKGRFLQ
jgi:putative hemolysin